MVGSDLPEQRLLVLMDILGLNPAQRSELVAFLRTEGSLLKSAGLSPALQQVVRDMNEDTWFKLDGKVTGMFGWCRPGEQIADLVFVFMFGKVLKEVRSVLMEKEYGWTLGYNENQYAEARARGHTACGDFQPEVQEERGCYALGDTPPFTAVRCGHHFRWVTPGVLRVCRLGGSEKL